MTNVGALTFSGVGGFALDVGEIRGTQVSFYPEPVETAACEATFDDPRVGDQSEKGLVALKADVDDILIPADSRLNLTKDIPTPEISGMEGVRIRLSRKGLISNPSYPPRASSSSLVSIGDEPQSFVDGVEFNGIFTFTGSSDGYADITFERTEPLTAGESANISVTAHGFTDYSPVEATQYPVTPGSRADRYISGVSGPQELDNQNTGHEGGYADYTNLNNTGAPPDNGLPVLERGSSQGITVTGVASPPIYGPLDTVRSDPDVNVDLPDSQFGDDSAQSYINDVTFDTISDTGTGDDGGYRDAWGQTTSNLAKGGSVDITVSGSKKTGSFGEATPDFAGLGEQAEEVCNSVNRDKDGNLQGSSECFYVTQTTWPSETVQHGNFVGDDSRGYTDLTNYNSNGNIGQPQLVQPGDRVEIGGCVQAPSLGSGKDLQVGVNFLRAFVDWEDNGYNPDTSPDDDYLVAVVTNGDGGGSIQESCNSRSIAVPETVSPGTGTVRFLSNGGLAGSDTGAPSSDFGPGGTDRYNEGVDRTIHVQHSSDVNAYFDWNQDGNFEDEVNVGSSLDRTGTFSYSTPVNVPEDPISGATAMRVVHRNELQDPQPVMANYVGETHDYTVEVEETRTEPAVYAYFDWNRDGEFDDEQYLGSSTTTDGSFTIPDSIDVPPDASAGSTIMRVVYQQNGWGPGAPNASSGPGANPVGITGEVHDYTVNVEPDGSYLRAWVNWDGDGFQEVADFGTTNEGYGEGNFDNEGSFTLTDEITNPGGLTQDVHLLRITHKQDIPTSNGGSPPVPGEGNGGWTGETLDFTVMTDPSLDPDTGNLTLGQGSFVATQLSAETFELSGDVLIDERYTDNTLENPKFGPNGEFILSGEQAVLENVTGVSHFLGFSFFEFPGLRLEVDYLGQEAENNPDEYIFGADQCGPYP